MKKTLLTVLGVSAYFLASAQMPAIPNAGFENWTKNPPIVGTDNPDNWATTNEVADFGVLDNELPNVTKIASPKHGGAAAIQLKTIYLDSNPFSGLIPDTLPGVALTGSSIMQLQAGGGFPITGKPGKLNGYYAYLAASGSKDSGIVAVTLTRFNTVTQAREEIAYGEMMFGNSPSTSAMFPFSAPLTYMSNETADTATIFLISSGGFFPAPGSLMGIDDLEFVAGSGNSIQEISKVKIDVYPNPATDVVALSSYPATASFARIMDANGRIVKTITLDKTGSTKVDVSTFPAGNYYFMLLSKSRSVEASGRLNIAR